MLFVVLCFDRPGSEGIRQATREAHLEFVAASGERVKAAGPFTSDDGSKMIGSMLVIEAESRADAEAWAALDPYARAGLFEDVEVRAWRWLINPPEDNG